jgi:hypothetical protein
MKKNIDNKFISDLTDKFKEKKISNNSIKLYIRNLEKLNDKEPIKNFKFLENIESIEKKLERYKDNTKRSYYIAICSTLNMFNDNKKIKKLYDEYFKKMMELNKKLKIEESKNIMSDTQKKNWIEQDELDKFYNDLKDEVVLFSKNKDINETKYKTLLKYVVLSLYYLQPPRRNLDYQKMNIVKVDGKINNEINYLSYDDKEFIFNVFKTSKTEGQVRVKITDKMMDVINIYVKFHPLIMNKIVKKTDVAFLVNFNGEKLDKINSITRILNSIFGKNIGSSLLRHFFLSNKYGSIIKEQTKDANDMSHSKETQQNYIKTN